MQFIRIDMSDQSVKLENVPEKYNGLGGRGLTSYIINHEVPPQCDPLGAQNKLVFAPGFLSGTTLINTSRISIGSKSPLTGGIKESNAGGTLPTALGKLHIAAVVIEGQAPTDKLFQLVIDSNGIAELLPADDYRGMRTYALADNLLQAHGPKNGILCIGPAGEFMLSSASIQSTDVDGHPCRAAGRGGLGAVMGSKGLKAIVVSLEGKRSPDIANPEAFKKASKTLAQAVMDNPFSGQALRMHGTAGLVAPVNALGAFPCFNATKGVFEGWEKISGEALTKTIQARGGQVGHRGCSQCIVHCSNVYTDHDGKYMTASLEYETIWSMGGMTGIDELDVIAKLDFLADDIGLDTINTGVAMGVAMDAGYRNFGDGEAAIEMMEAIAKGTDIGRVLGNGPVTVGEYFNHQRVPVVKGQSIAAYDPRAMQGNGVTYATSPMGADHTAGNLVGRYTSGMMDPLGTEGQIEASREAQIAMAALDSTGLCLLAGVALAAPEALQAMVDIINAKLGTKMTPQDYSAMGKMVLKAELEFNSRAGFTKKDNRLANFFYEEPLPPHNKPFLIKDEELDRVFDF